jgi:hypothetical protein
MAWCHACEEKKRIERTVTGEFTFNKKKETFKKFVERQRKQKRSGFSFKIGKNK